MDGAERIIDAMTAFLGCLAEAVSDVCSYGWTMGDSYVPFDPDADDETCDEMEDEALCSQLWVRVNSVTPVILTDSFSDGGCDTQMQLDIEVGILRCIEIPEGGEAPTASDVLVAAMQSMTDMNRVYCGAMGCEVWDSIDAGQWNPMGPLGGQYGGDWSFTVRL